ncbi:hypothetical protein BDB01DRAFT_849044 [Pilobolus umbonatus]|nr:hypothetical protein BDB01DRAFT_849044 [Pilobolus umbonatus]
MACHKDVGLSYQLTESILSLPTSLSTLNQPSTSRLLSPHSMTDHKQSMSSFHPQSVSREYLIHSSTPQSSQDIESNHLHTTKHPTWYEYDTIEQCLSLKEFFSLGSFLFLFGFLFPPLWWVGSFLPRVHDQNKMDERWRLLNRYFSLGFSTLLIIALIVLAMTYK